MGLKHGGNSERIRTCKKLNITDPFILRLHTTLFFICRQIGHRIYKSFPETLKLEFCILNVKKKRVSVSQKKPFISITKTNRLKLFREIISLFWDPYKTMKNLCGQCAEFWQCQSKWYTKLPLCFRGLKDISKQKIEQHFASLCLYIFLKKSDVIGMSNIFPVPYVIYIPITWVSTLVFMVSSSVSVCYLG